MATISSLSHLLFCLFLRKDLHFAPFYLSRLVATSYLFTPNHPLFTPKTSLFNDYFALFNHVFHGSKRFYLYHFSGYLCFSPRILQYLALHFAPFYLAFSTKTHCI